MTENTPGMMEYLSGNPNAPGYRQDHGGGNYHDHLAFQDTATALKVKQALEAAGIRTTGWGDQSGHAANSYHKYKEAIDVPGKQWGKGTDAEVFAGSQKVRQITRSVLGATEGKPSAAPAIANTDGTVEAPPGVTPAPPPAAPIEIPLPSVMAVNPVPMPQSSVMRAPATAGAPPSTEAAWAPQTSSTQELLALAGLNQKPRNALASRMRTPMDGARADDSAAPTLDPFQALLRAY
jgi:hypothetical protein